MESIEQLNDPNKDALRYSVPWKPVDNWIAIFLLGLIDAALLYFASQGIGSRLAQSAAFVLVQLIYLIPVLTVFVYRRISLRSIGFGKFKWSTLGLGCGLLIGSYFLIMIHNGILALLGIGTQGQEILKIFGSLDTPVWFVLVGVIVAPVVEEIFFRGFLFQGFRQRYGWISGALISSAVFAIGHLDPVALFPAFILGLLFAYIYHRTNSIWPGIILHFLVNAFGFCSLYAVTQLSDFIPL